MAKPNRKCFFCGKEYHYCSTCPNDIKKPSWYVMWCSEQCKALDNIVAAHRTGKITTEEAKNKINELNIDVDNLKFARESLKEYFNNIMSYKSENMDNIDKDNIDENVDEIKIENIESVKTVENIENVEDGVNIESAENKKTRIRKTKIVSKSKIEENKEENK